MGWVVGGRCLSGKAALRQAAAHSDEAEARAGELLGLGPITKLANLLLQISNVRWRVENTYPAGTPAALGPRSRGHIERCARKTGFGVDINRRPAARLHGHGDALGGQPRAFDLPRSIASRGSATV